MESVLLSAPEGILARLGWDPRLDERARILALARELVAEHEGVDEDSVRVDYETPAQFGHLVQLEATVSGAAVPSTIKAASFRTATVVAVADANVPIGLDIRDLQPDAVTLREMRRHSHLIDGGSDQSSSPTGRACRPCSPPTAAGCASTPSTCGWTPGSTRGGCPIAGSTTASGPLAGCVGHHARLRRLPQALTRAPGVRIPPGSAASSSASHARALPSDGARQSPRGDSDPAGTPSVRSGSPIA